MQTSKRAEEERPKVFLDLTGGVSSRKDEGEDGNETSSSEVEDEFEAARKKMREESKKRLAEAFRGRDLLAMLEALQGFELKNEDMTLLDTDAVMVVATATMYVTSNVAQKLKAMSNDEANKFALPMNNLYQLLVDLINELHASARP